MLEQQKIIIYDASLLVDAYETQLFRTGLYRVCSELLKQLVATGMFEIWLYDVMGRERIIRQYIIPQWNGVNVLGVHSNRYQKIAYPLLRAADGYRQKQSGRFGLFFKALKNICTYLAKSCHRIYKDKTLVLPDGTANYISTYYPVPAWVHEHKLRATLIVHDLIPLIHPEWFPNDANRHLLGGIIHSVKETDTVVCVSSSTRSDFLRFRMDFLDRQVLVAHLAGAECFSPKDLKQEIKDRYDIEGNDYLLSVCTLEPRKNLLLVIQAYELLLQKMSSATPKLLLVGAMGWKTDSLIDKIEQINEQYPNAIVITGYLDDEELAQLYSNTLAFVYVSLYEGFGLPPLEAMQCGAAVIVSDCSSLPEVVGEAGIQVSAADKNQLFTAILNILDKDNASLKEKSLAQASCFSWSNLSTTIINTL